MGVFFVYILKSSICLVLFYFFYKLLLSRDTFHRFNRIALSGLVLLSIVIPFIQITVKEPVTIQQSFIDLEQVLVQVSSQMKYDATPFWIKIVLSIYFVGCIFFLCRLIYSGYRLYWITRKGRHKRLESGIHLITLSEPVSPFSWMNCIVISEKDLKENGVEIITHETAHVKAHHSVDIIFTELCILFHWFNPVIWLIKKEFENIHEYEADASVLSHGIDAKKYQLLLIRKAVGSQRFTSMANSFNHSSLKKRISMMLKSKSNPMARLKYFFVLPLTAFTIAVFARPEINQELKKVSSVKISKNNPIEERVNLTNQREDIIVSVNNSTNKPEDSQSFTLEKSKEPLVLLDGKEISYSEMNEIDTQTIESVNVIKEPDESIKQYGAKGVNGVIIITSKKP